MGSVTDLLKQNKRSGKHRASVKQPQNNVRFTIQITKFLLITTRFPFIAEYMFIYLFFIFLADFFNYNFKKMNRNERYNQEVVLWRQNLLLTFYFLHLVFLSRSFNIRK